MLSSQDESAQILTRLGLTSCQARVYLALVRSGISTAKTISKVSKVARQDTYRITAGLQKLGLVEKAVTIPAKFRAIPIQDALSILLQNRTKENSELQAKADELLKNFKKNSARTRLQTEEPQFFLIPKREILLKAIREFKNAQTTIDSITSLKKFLPWVFTHAELYEKALKRGVKIRLITDKPEDEKSLPEVAQALKKDPYFKVRYVLSIPPADIGLYDKKVVYIDTSATAGLEETPCYYSNNPCLLKIVQDYYEILWITALTNQYEEP